MNIGEPFNAKDTPEKLLEHSTRRKSRYKGEGPQVAGDDQGKSRNNRPEPLQWEVGPDGEPGEGHGQRNAQPGHRCGQQRGASQDLQGAPSDQHFPYAILRAKGPQNEIDQWQREGGGDQEGRDPDKGRGPQA